MRSNDEEEVDQMINEAEDEVMSEMIDEIRGRTEYVRLL